LKTFFVSGSVVGASRYNDFCSTPSEMNTEKSRLSSVDRAPELFAIVTGCEWMLDLIGVVSTSGLPDAWIGAGAIRDLVWDSKFGAGFDSSRVKDVDVAFFDKRDLRPERDRRAADVLKHARPQVNWDAKNQAAVHTWYEARYGVRVDAFRSIREAVGSWPETATAVAIRVAEPNGPLEVLAPCGLDDLLDGLWRRNPVRVSASESLRRLADKRKNWRWPGVRVIGDAD
jgi:uncharacterized protein